ncbi:MFS transporter [Paraburkholderia tropica]|uniref:MFS transporter, MHS family, proline/betaine transporter n=1 Tax=Paraburkholderia tropica TaxID=92647 RepID=A0AAQ1GPH1_9BURK|nr:MFS transporter [Paraburkholderia tropica]RQN33891.1 MFS transporter [Paraburkholderia tropica]SEK15508.1 MFS transporter, MHS family, proline/betaine transporter [Paraburkholderia tropica]
MSSTSHNSRSTDAAPPTTSGAEQRRAIGAGMVGYILEWFDFGVYGFLAATIAKNFFPSTDEFTSLLASFAVFGVGFVARPIGSLVLGRIADTRGRHITLATSMILMAASTVAIGLLPTYNRIGIWAPALLVLARLAQGFAAGGEWGTAAAFLVEWGGTSRRGFFGAFQQSSIATGLLLGSLAAAILSSTLSASELSAWGWRIPFLIGALLGPVGMYVRRRVQESPAYENSASQSVALSRRQFAKSVFHAFSFVILWAVSSYMVSVYMPTFANKYAHISQTQALWTSTASLATVMICAPLMGALSDRIGRKPVLLTSCLFFLFLSYPLYAFIVSGISFMTFFFTQLLMNLAFIMYSGPGPSALAEMFPTRVRSTGVSFGGALATILGGFSPLLTTWTISHTGASANAGWLLAGSALLTLPALIFMKDRARQQTI